MVYTDSEPKGGIHPLALAARAAAIMEYLTQTADEFGGSSENSWIGWGIKAACKALVETGDLAGLGAFLQGLETLVDPEYRAEWPLHEKCEPFRRYGAEPAIDEAA